jgi:uncharacterized DUF497 family protein
VKGWRCSKHGGELLVLNNLVVSKSVEQKLASKHQVTVDEVCQAFVNRGGGFLEDTREEHRTDPPTQWFVGTTNHGRLLKIVFVNREGKITLKTAYDANAVEAKIYELHAK